MPGKKSKTDKKSPKQTESIELSEEQASQVRGGADGSVRNWDMNIGGSPTLNPTNKTLKQKP